MTCNPHPDAPHGFDRNRSHDEGRYACDCESWYPPHEYRDDVKPARNEEALHLLRTDPAEYFRRKRVQAQWVQAQWFRPDPPESEKLLRQERQRLAVTESWWGIRFRIAKLLRRMADRIYREGWGSD